MDLGIAVVGAGYWGPNIIRTIQQIPGCRLTWVCDSKPGRLHYVRERWPHLAVTQQFNDVLEDRATEALILATPVSTHHALGLSAIHAGKHILVEKPLAASSKDAGALVCAAERYGRTLAVGHLFAYHSAVIEMKRILQSGALGKHCYTETSRVNLGPPASEVNVIWDLATHDLSITLHLLNKFPVSLTALGRRFVHPSLVDAAFLHLQFPDGSISQHHVSWLSAQKVRRVFVAGTEGSLKFDDTMPTGKLEHVDQGEDTRIGLKDDEAKELYYKPGKVRSPELTQAEPLRVEVEDFLEAIRDSRPPLADGRAGLEVVRLLEAADCSIADGGRTITLAEPD